METEFSIVHLGQILFCRERCIQVDNIIVVLQLIFGIDLYGRTHDLGLFVRVPAVVEMDGRFGGNS